MISCGRDLTKFYEGLTLTAKPDDRGAWVIGRGHDIPAPAPGSPIPQWSEDEADCQFEADYELAMKRARTDVGAVVYDAICEPRQAVFSDMAFEIGGAGLAGFRNMIACAAAADWEGAAVELVASHLYQQVPRRVEMNASILRTGAYPIGL